jgi:hypothetical protein
VTAAGRTMAGVTFEFRCVSKTEQLLLSDRQSRTWVVVFRLERAEQNEEGRDPYREGAEFELKVLDPQLARSFEVGSLYDAEMNPSLRQWH